MSEEKEVLLGFLIGSISILRDMNIQFTEKSRNKLADKIMELVIAYERQQKEIEELKDNYSDEKIRNTIIKRYREVIEKDYVSKDKIKAKLKELKHEKSEYEDSPEWELFDYLTAQIEVLESLLKEE